MGRSKGQRYWIDLEELLLYRDSRAVNNKGRSRSNPSVVGCNVHVLLQACPCTRTPARRVRQRFRSGDESERRDRTKGNATEIRSRSLGGDFYREGEPARRRCRCQRLVMVCLEGGTRGDREMGSP